MLLGITILVRSIRVGLAKGPWSMRPIIAVISLIFAAPSGFADPPDLTLSKLERKDRHGDPLPEGALQRYGSSRFRAGADLLSLKYSPDGKRIAALSADRLTIWDGATGAPIRIIRGGGFSLMTFDRDDRQVTIFGAEHAQTFEIASGMKLSDLQFGESANCLIDAVSPDGRFVAASRKEAGDRFEIQVWRLANPSEVVSRLLEHVERRPEIAWSPDQKQIALGYATGRVDILDATTYKLIRMFNLEPKYISLVGLGDEQGSAGRERQIQLDANSLHFRRQVDGDCR
jgi:WD40 repeat protein